MSNVRLGKCEFADRSGRKHRMTWIATLDENFEFGKKYKIRKTDILNLKIQIDDEVTAWFEDGRWNKRPPLFGASRDAYNAVLALYS